MASVDRNAYVPPSQPLTFGAGERSSDFGSFLVQPKPDFARSYTMTARKAAGGWVNWVAPFADRLGLRAPAPIVAGTAAVIGRSQVAHETRIFSDLSLLEQAEALRADGRVRELVTAGGTLVQAYRSGETLSPPAVVDGGFGVVASVLGRVVTLASGSTLVSGLVRLWSVAAGEHLGDAVAGEVNGLEVTVVDPTGLEAGDVIYGASLRYTDFGSLISLLTAVGSAFDEQLELHNRTTGQLIGAWRYNAASAIALHGLIDFTVCSDSRSALVVSTDGATVTCSAHNVTALSGTLRILDRTTGAEYGDVPFTRSGNIFTVGSDAATAVQGRLTAGSAVELIDVDACELCIGDSTRFVNPLAGGVATVRSGVGVTGSGNVVVWPRWSPASSLEWSLQLGVSYARSAEADGQRIKFAAWQSSLKHAGAGLQRVSGADKMRPTYGAISSPTEANLANDDAAAYYPFTRLRLRVDCSAGDAYLTSVAYPTFRRTILLGTLTAAPTGILLRTVPAGAEVLTATLRDAVCG